MPSKSRFVAYIVGPAEFARYVIKDNRVREDRFFVAEGQPWTDDLKAARKYVNLDDLSRDIEQVHVAELGHTGVRRYAFAVDVIVLGGATRDQVREYLREALLLCLDYENHGSGPTNDSVVLVATEVSTLREVANEA